MPYGLNADLGNFMSGKTPQGPYRKCFFTSSQRGIGFRNGFPGGSFVVGISLLLNTVAVSVQLNEKWGFINKQAEIIAPVPEALLHVIMFQRGMTADPMTTPMNK